MDLAAVAAQLVVLAVEPAPPVPAARCTPVGRARTAAMPRRCYLPVARTLTLTSPSSSLPTFIAQNQNDIASCQHLMDNYTQCQSDARLH